MGPPPTADCNKAVCSFKTLDDTFRNCSLLFQSLPSKQATSITSHDCCLESLGNSGILWTFAVPFRSANKHLVQMMAFDALPCLPWAKWDTSTAFCEYLSTKHLISLHCMISSSMLFAALAIQTQLALSSASFDPPSWAKTQLLLLLLRVPAQHHNACSLNAVAHYFALFRPRNIVIFGRAMSWQPCHALFWGFLKPTPQPLTFECSENRFDDLRWIWLPVIGNWLYLCFGVLEGSTCIFQIVLHPEQSFSKETSTLLLGALTKELFKCLCSIVWSFCFNFSPNTVYLRFLLEIKDRPWATRVWDFKLCCWWGLQLKEKEWEKNLEIVSWLEGQACPSLILGSCAFFKI